MQKKYIPLSLIVFRLLLAPVIILLVYFLREESRIPVIILMYLGLISDIFDGIIARELNVASQNLRRFDSQTDMIFWVSIGVGTWMLYPDLIRDNKVSIIIIFIMEALCYLISIAKFGKETCTHAFLSKMFGVTMLIAFTSLIGFNHAGFPFYLALIFGLISHIDRILITLILPAWTHDVPSFYHAYLIRKGIPFKKNKLFN
ncbi:MAG TPA: CDP-alcohol phosphatidyltransferase family protein [Saprospiraceae bacterium]|nr:CDP-alcohol phosphatidyltransferase family protein [Saprospiraceae bacterium]HMU02254.1 CDP-alcohol phosphatidyltransferase family protein [Saprospiraceae bacterium]